MMFYNPNGNSVCSCPLCNETGILTFVEPVLMNKVFKYKEIEDECPICEGWGLVEIKDDKDEHRTTNNPARDIHSGGSSFL